jgi:hypothetical protein
MRLAIILAAFQVSLPSDLIDKVNQTERLGINVVTMSVL